MNEILRSIIAHREITFADSCGTQYRFTMKDGLVTLHTKDPANRYFRKVLDMDELEFLEMFGVAISYVRGDK
jgi:hypothetical protein